MGFQGWSPPGFPAGCCQERHHTCGTWWDTARCSPQPFPARGPGVRMLLARLERPKLVCCRWRSCHLELFPPGGQTPPSPSLRSHRGRAPGMAADHPGRCQSYKWHNFCSSQPAPGLLSYEGAFGVAFSIPVVLRSAGGVRVARAQPPAHSALAVGGTRASQACLLPSVAMARGADVLLTHHLSLSSRPC